MALPMLGNGLLIAAGDLRRAARMSAVGSYPEHHPDPILIFGCKWFPGHGIRGAALATGAGAAGRGGVLALRLLMREHRLLVCAGARDWLDSFRNRWPSACPIS